MGRLLQLLDIQNPALKPESTNGDFEYVTMRQRFEQAFTSGNCIRDTPNC